MGQNDLAGNGPLETAMRDLEQAEARLKQAWEAQAIAEREVAQAIEKVRDAEREFVTVHVVHVNEVEHTSFEERRTATLQHVWDESYHKLEISRNPKDVFQTAGEHPVSLMSHLGLTLEQAFREKVIENYRFGIASETGGA
jgi:hypothetical protein